KPVNLGNLSRSAHAFGASFVFTIGADPRTLEPRSDTSRAESHVPLYHWPALPSSPCPKAAAWLASRSSTRPPILRAFRIPSRLPMYLDPNGERLRPSLPTSANISYAFHRPFPSMLRPPARVRRD